MVKIEPVFEISSNTTTRNFTALITFNENRKPQYIGRCKLKIDLLSNCLFVEPKNKRFNDISAIFEWKFIRLKNVLFVFATLDVQDFVLVFKNEKICIKVYNEIFKNRDADSVEDKLLKERFLNPFFKNASQNSRMKEIFEEWIQKFDEKEKNEYLKLLKWHQQNPEIDDDENDIKNVKVEIEPLGKNRKRRHHKIESTGISHSLNVGDQGNFDGLNGRNNDVSEECQTKKLNSSDRFKKVVDNSKFKFVNFKTGKRFLRKLLIFTSSAKTKCYEFKFYPGKKYFFHRCFEKLNGIKAIFDVDGKECIKMEDKKHSCSPIFYEPEKYIELKIVKKPDYEILENCATKSGRILIIFDSADRNQCYEYFWNFREKIYYCCGCKSKGKERNSAEIYHENTETEYVILSNEDHICEMRKYNPEKYFSSNQFILSPNFEFQTKITNGIERKTLIIFDENDRNFCYAYYCSNSTKKFYCNGCFLKNRKKVSAKVCKNDENEEYVILSNLKHHCSPRNYVPPKKIIILRPPKFEFIQAPEKFTSKLIIFDLTDPTLCYVFSQNGDAKRYRCLGCKTVAEGNQNINPNKSHTNRVMYVILDKTDGPDGEYFVQTNDREKHICQPKKYEPEKYEMKILMPTIDYVLFRNKGRSGENIHLVIHHENDKKLCYKYCYIKANKFFRCSACWYKNTFAIARLHQDSDGNEYLTTNKKKHVCAAKKYSSFIKPDTLILEKSGLAFEEKKKNEIDKERIIRLPDFELRQNSKGVPERRLIIFCDDERKLCYDYGYNNRKFTCKKCNISAKIQIDKEDGNEKFIIMSENKHKCEPVKYVPEKKIIELNEPENGTSNFMIFNRDDEKKQTKLVIFTSSTKKLCYQYYYCKKSKTFWCGCCIFLKKYVSVKLLKDHANEKEYIQFLKNDHVCSPKKFILEEFQPKIIPESGFKLCSNRNGKPNSKLILFDPEKDGFVYEYYLTLTNYFACLQCNYKNVTVSAKVFENENGEKYLELSSTKHVCESKKYEPEKLKLKTNFVIHYNDSGVPDSRITVFNDDDRSLGYRYNFSIYQNSFYCVDCRSKKKYSSAKLTTDNNGNQSLEFSQNEHFCIAQNLKKEKLYFDDFKFEENGKTLITNDPIQKNRFFKFACNEKLGIFCCVKCLEKKKKYVTATICKENDGKEPRLKKMSNAVTAQRLHFLSCLLNALAMHSMRIDCICKSIYCIFGSQCAFYRHSLCIQCIS